MSTHPRPKARVLPEKDLARDLRKFEALTDEQKAAARLHEDTDKTSGTAATKVRKKVKAANLDGGGA